MWPYVAVFLSAVAVDSIPVFAPPAWPILIFFQIHYGLNVWAVILLGVTGTTLGRFILSLYIPWVGHQILNRRGNGNLEFLGKRLSASPTSAFTFVLLYSLTPLSTTALFTAAGVAKVRRAYILPPFFLGKLISYSALILTGHYAATHAEAIWGGSPSWKTLLPAGVGLLLILGFLFIDWKRLLLHKEFCLHFNIWKWSHNSGNSHAEGEQAGPRKGRWRQLSRRR